MIWQGKNVTALPSYMYKNSAIEIPLNPSFSLVDQCGGTRVFHCTCPQTRLLSSNVLHLEHLKVQMWFLTVVSISSALCGASTGHFCAEAKRCPGIRITYFCLDSAWSFINVGMD